MEVENNLHYWISTQPMVFFQLKWGMLILPKWKNEQKEDDVFLKFPWPASSMKKIENCVKNRPFFHCLSFMPLPETDHPLPYVMSRSTLNGWIENEYWRMKATQPGHWLASHEILLLSAFFLRIGLEQNLVHVFSPDHTKHMKTFFEITECIAKEKRQPKDDQRYNVYIEYFSQYVDSVHDLFEHKFLLFLCNPSEMHWITIVVVNPSLLYNSVHKSKTIQPGQTDNFCGFSVFDSMAMSKQDLPEAKAKGLIPTSNAKYRISYGVHLFLNFCASYLYSINKGETSDGLPQITFAFEQPFGLWYSSGGTNEFPHFDYNFPSILCQHDQINCGFACVANAFAFVKHLKDINFSTTLMIPVKEGHFFLDRNTYSLQPFWENVAVYARTHGGYNLTTGSLLSCMHEEYCLVLEDLSTLYLADKKSQIDNAKKEGNNKEHNQPDNRKTEFLAGIKKKRRERRLHCRFHSRHG
jgi:hypothetical protein